MRQIIGSFVVVLTVASLAGCASSNKAAHARSSGDVVASMNDELAHTLDTSPGGDAVGTTTVTSGTMDAPAAEPMPLPEERMSLARQRAATKEENTPPQNPPTAPTIPSSGN